MGLQGEHLFPHYFGGFIVDVSISAQRIWRLRHLFSGFGVLVGLTGVHTGMEHLFPYIVFWCRSSPSAFPIIYTQPSLKRRFPSAYPSILTLAFMACEDPHSRIGAIYCGSRLLSFEGIVCKTFQRYMVANGKNLPVSKRKALDFWVAQKKSIPFKI